MARTARRSNFGNVEKLPSGRYRAFYKLEGERFAAPRTFKTKADAETWLAGEQADRHRGQWHDPRLGQITLRDYANAWLTARPDLAPRTRDLYRYNLDRWVLSKIAGDDGRGVELGRLELAQITQTTVRTWYARVLEAARASALAKLTPTERAHPARAWGRANGFEVKRQGLMSPQLLAAWEAAGRPDAPKPQTLEDEHRDAGKTTASQVYRLLHGILATAAREGQIAANPCQIAKGGAVQHPERKIATPAEVDELAAAFPEHLRAAVLLAAWSGLRYGELFGLSRRHVDLAAGTVRVERALVTRSGHAPMLGDTKTASSHRTVHVPAFVVDQLRTHLAQHVPAYPDALLFTENGKPVTNSRVSWLMRRARATIDRPDLTWHSLRHCAAVFGYLAGATQRDVQNRLGHSTARAAAIYQHAVEDADQRLAENLDQLRSSGRTARVTALSR